MPIKGVCKKDKEGNKKVKSPKIKEAKKIKETPKQKKPKS